jgi:hypothetical protein
MTTHPNDELLHDFVDGRLDEIDRDAIALHLLDCPRCQTIVAATEELIDTGRAAREERAAPADLWPLVAATTIHERVVKRHVLRSVRRELAFAAAVLILLSGAAGAFGMRIAMRAGDGLRAPGARSHDTRVRLIPEIVSVTPEFSTSRHREVIARGGSGGGGGVAIATPHPPFAPAPPDPHLTEDEAGAVRTLAEEFVTQLMARESRELSRLAQRNPDFRSMSAVEDGLFKTNRQLTQLRLAYHNSPRDSAIGKQIEELFDRRLEIIRAAAAAAEEGNRQRERSKIQGEPE